MQNENQDYDPLIHVIRSAGPCDASNRDAAWLARPC